MLLLFFFHTFYSAYPTDAEDFCKVYHVLTKIGILHYNRTQGLMTISYNYVCLRSWRIQYQQVFVFSFTHSYFHVDLVTYILHICSHIQLFKPVLLICIMGSGEYDSRRDAGKITITVSYVRLRFTRIFMI